MTMHEELLALLNDFDERGYVTPAQIVGNIAVIGLLDPNAPKPVAKTLREGLRSGVLKVVDRGGVNDLRFETNEPILIRKGEGVSKGGRQDRIVQTSQVIETPTQLGVYCIESGRWGQRGQDWNPVDIPVPIRRAAADNKSQSEVWSFIKEYLRSWDISSRTSALTAVYDALGPQFEKFLGNFEWWKDQVGMVVVINKVVSGVEIFDSRETFHSEGMSLLRDSYIPECLHDQPSLRKLMMPDDVVEAMKVFRKELEEGKRRVDITKYRDRIIYANVI